MIITVQTQLDAPPEKVWHAVKSLNTFRHVTRGMLGVTATKANPHIFEEPLTEGKTFEVRMWFFNVLPAWKHTLHVHRLDDQQRELLTHEHGAFITTWNHLIRVQPGASGGTHYTDQIDIKAGLLTLGVVAFAHIFYRYRQSRWRRLARTL